ncbi:MAG: hypothetical protein ACRD96_00755 [Bryobacteraceae bacterium]
MKNLWISTCLLLGAAIAFALRVEEVPANTTLVVRMLDEVDSKIHSAGQTFRATIDEPVMVGGETVVPKGAEVVTKLIAAKKSGRILGRSELTLDLVSITLNGRSIDLLAADVRTTGKSRTKESAAVIGGATALGAVLGGVAGGGKGAAIGAITGAGAGSAVQILTRGSRLRIPAETRLSFTLQHPLRV